MLSTLETCVIGLSGNKEKLSIRNIFGTYVFCFRKLEFKSKSCINLQGHYSHHSVFLWTLYGRALVFKTTVIFYKIIGVFFKPTRFFFKLTGAFFTPSFILWFQCTPDLSLNLPGSSLNLPGSSLNLTWGLL